jgi:O-antigen ligase
MTDPSVASGSSSRAAAAGDESHVDGAASGVDERVRLVLVGAYVLGLGVSISLAETALAFLALRAVWRVARGHARPSWPLAWPIGALITATAVAAALSAHPGESLLAARGVLHILTIWVVIDALPSLADAGRTLRWLLAAVSLAALVGILQVTFCAELAAWVPVLGRVARKCHRAHGFFSIYMTLAGVLNVVLLASLPELLARRHPRWTPAAWALSLVGLALTYVRGAWLGFGAGSLVLAAGVKRRRRLALAGGLVLAGIVLLLIPGVRGRARSIVDLNDPTSSERVHMWRSGFAMARDHLLTGVGPGQVRRVYPDYAAAEVAHKHRGHLHSSPIQILVERGVLGLAAWLWLFGAFFVRAAGIARRAAGRPDASALVSGAIAATAGFLVAGLTEHNFGDTEVLLAATFAMALAFVADREGRPPRTD